MRMLVNSLVALCALALGGLLYLKSAGEADEAERAERAIQAIREVEQTLYYKAAVERVPTNSRGWPLTIDPAWFKTGLPRNPLLSNEHPWLEVASNAEAGLKNPTVRLAVSPALAGIWYNPYQGVVRARVPVQISDVKSTALYNLVNGTDLSSILMPETPSEINAAEAGPQAQVFALPLPDSN